jgi:hypothetical protein
MTDTWITYNGVNESCVINDRRVYETFCAHKDPIWTEDVKRLYLSDITPIIVVLNTASTTLKMVRSQPSFLLMAYEESFPIIMSKLNGLRKEKAMKTALMSELKHISAQSVEKFKKWAGKGPTLLVSGREKTPIGVYLPIKEYERLVKQHQPAWEESPFGIEWKDGRGQNNKRLKTCACGSTHGDTHTNGCDGIER